MLLNYSLPLLLYFTTDTYEYQTQTCSHEFSSVDVEMYVMCSTNLHVCDSVPSLSLDHANSWQNKIKNFEGNDNLGSFR